MANSTQKSTPRDAQVMAAILKDCGVGEYEPRLVHQMLDFTYQYVTDVLEDAKVYSQHANKKNLDLDDVKLAVQCRTDHSFTNPPPKEMLQEMGRLKNGQLFPPIKAYGGPRSMSDRYCLTNPNYRLKSSKKPPSRIQFGLPSQPRITLPAQAKGLAVKGLGNSGQSVTVLPKASPSGTGATSQVTIIGKPATTPKPTIRINTGPAVAAGIGASGLAQIMTQQTTSASTISLTLPPASSSSAIAETAANSAVPITATLGVVSATDAFNPLKRKAEEDDYDA